MSISSGTWTFGVGGTYGGIISALGDIAASLTGDLTLNQVGPSIEVGASVNNSVSLSGFTLRVQCLTPHFGNPTLAYPCDFKRINTQFPQAGNLVLENLMLRPTELNSWSYTNAASGDVDILIKNNLFLPSASNVYALWLNTLYPSAGNSLNQIVGNKFYSNGTTACLLTRSGSGANASRVSWWVENNSIYRRGSTNTTSAALVLNSGAGGAFQVAVCSAKNNLVLLEFPAVYGVNLGLNPSIVAFSQNARNASGDSETWAYSGMLETIDFGSLDPTNANFLNDLSSSVLRSNGATPSASQNPYLSAPFPIGNYTAPLVTGGGANGLSVGLLTAAGVGYKSSPYSRILPGASGSISHARILKGYRTAEQAADFHQLMGGT